MSPSEFDLRAALHDGEGDHVNVDQLVLAARAGAASRRARLLSTAAIVAVVAGAGVGGALLASSGNDSRLANTQAGGGVYGRAATAPPHEALGGAGTAGQGGAPVPAPVYGALSGAGSRCPPAADATLRPAAAKLDADAPLFSRPVSTLLVCSYQLATRAKSAASPTSVTLHGADARLVTASLEGAAKTPPTGRCPDIRSATQRNLVFQAFSPSGASAGEVTVSLAFSPCEVRVTSDNAVRYAWVPSEAVARLLARTALSEQAASRNQPTPSSSPS
jgi:hypothetical protein